MTGGKHKTLSLVEKVKLIVEHQRDKRSPKELVQKFKVGKTQVYDTLKNKDKIMSQWLRGDRLGQSRRLGKVSSNKEINNAVWVWFVSTRAKGLPISGPMLQAKALDVAEKLGKKDFKASNGWLDSFKSRNNIVFKKLFGESSDVNVHRLKKWEERIQQLRERFNLSFTAETVIHFDDNLSVFEDVGRAIDMLEEKEEREEDVTGDVEKEEAEMKIKTFSQALKAVNELEEFSAFKNCAELLQVLQKVKEVLFENSLKTRRQTRKKKFFKKT